MDKINYKPISTSIKKVVPFQNGFLIMEDYYKFKGKSNLYYRKDNEILYYFSFNRDEDEVYVDFNLDEKFIIAWTWSAFRVKFNFDGSIISSEFTK